MEGGENESLGSYVCHVETKVLRNHKELGCLLYVIGIFLVIVFLVLLFYYVIYSWPFLVLLVVIFSAGENERKKPVEFMGMLRKDGKFKYLGIVEVREKGMVFHDRDMGVLRWEDIESMAYHDYIPAQVPGSYYTGIRIDTAKEIGRAIVDKHGERYLLLNANVYGKDILHALESEIKKCLGERAGGKVKPSSEAMENLALLKKRLASGEIDEEEYSRLKKVLEE